MAVSIEASCPAPSYTFSSGMGSAPPAWGVGIVLEGPPAQEIKNKMSIGRAMSPDRDLVFTRSTSLFLILYRYTRSHEHAVVVGEQVLALEDVHILDRYQ